MIAVIGLGNAGLPLAAVIADAGMHVVGIDINRGRCEMINAGINPIAQEMGLSDLIAKHGGKTLVASSDYKDASSCDAFIVIVPLFVDKDHSPDFRILEEAFSSIGSILKKGDLVVLETTVPPGTTESLVLSILERSSGLKLGDFCLAYSPERIMTGLSICRLREFPKVIGGMDQESGVVAYRLYSKFIPNLTMVSSARVAEMIKVMEGCYRDVNIALANELYRISKQLDVDFYEARNYANHQYCHIHLPSTGVGGHCIPVYPWFLIKSMEGIERFDDCRLLRTAREKNDSMADYWAERIILECLNIKKPLSDIKICITGITYRKGVKEFYHSRNLELVKLLARKGLNVSAWDELLTKEETTAFGVNWLKPEDADLVFDCFDMSLRSNPM
jgi:UDP-N-acetyl-D-mannosaminuronic acid dehydrogenase